MSYAIRATLFASLSLAFVIIGANCDSLIVCYYDRSVLQRSGLASMSDNQLIDGVQHCTHLIYGFVGIDSQTFAIDSSHFDANETAIVRKLKGTFPKLKVFVSVGGIAYETDPEKYLTLLENDDRLKSFAESAKEFLLERGFDGLDLAWQFPQRKARHLTGRWTRIWHGIKSIFVDVDAANEVDAKYRAAFANLTSICKNAFRHHELRLSMTLLPNVNGTGYADVRRVMRNVDFVSLLAFDFYTAARSPKEATFPAPLTAVHADDLDASVKSLVESWLQSGAANNKLVIGVPAFGRTWQITDKKYPPFAVNGPGAEGPLTKERGRMSYTEICTALKDERLENKLAKIRDPTKHFGTFAYRAADDDGQNGIWIGYDDVESVRTKANYAKDLGLGGLALYDVTLDDFGGVCGDTYPLLKTMSKIIGKI